MAVEQSKVQPGTVLVGRKGPDRLIVRRNGGEVRYVQRKKDGAFPAGAEKFKACFISTICEWSQAVKEGGAQ